MATNVGSQRLYTKSGFLDAGMVKSTLAEIESSKFDGMIKFCEEDEKYYGCTGGTIFEMTFGGSTGGVSISTYVKAVNGSEFVKVMDTTVPTEVAYYEYTLEKATHKLSDIIVGRFVDSAYDSCSVEVDWSEATKKVSVKAYATEQPSGSYNLILKGIR